MNMKMLALAGALCFSLAACGSDPVHLTEEQSTAQRTVIMNDDYIENLAVRSVVKNNGLLSVNLNGTGDTNGTVYVKVIWKNAEGMVINTAQSAWQKKKIISGLPLSWDFIAPNVSAKNYQIIVTDDIGSGDLEV